MNNPAQRLYSILSTLQQSAQNAATSHVLAHAFGIEPRPREIFHAISQFHQLVADVVVFASEKTNLPTAPLLRYLPQIESAVQFTNLDASWSAYVGRITPECLLILEMVAHVDGVEQDIAPSPEDLTELQTQLSSLFEFVSVQKGMDSQLRTFLLQQIEYIRRCLAEYRISGPQGFVKYLEQLMVQAVRQSEVIRKAKGNNSEVLGRFGKLLQTVKKFVSFTSDGVKLIEECKGTWGDATRLLGDAAGSASADVPEPSANDFA